MWIIKVSDTEYRKDIIDIFWEYLRDSRDSDYICELSAEEVREHVHQIISLGREFFYLFENIKQRWNIDWIYSKIHFENKASIRLHESLGFLFIPAENLPWYMAWLEL